MRRSQAIQLKCQLRVVATMLQPRNRNVDVDEVEAEQWDTNEAE